MNNNPDVIGYSYSAAPVTASWENSVEYTDGYNAVIKGTIRTSASVQFQEAGAYVWDNNGNLVAQASEGTSVSGSYMNITYNIIAEMGATLKPGTTYTYQFWAKAGGNIYYGDKANFRTTGPVHYDPEGYLDGVTGGANAISVQGWAVDRDNPSAQLQIHIYVGGPAGSGAAFYSDYAKVKRQDLSFLGLGVYHGFDISIPIEKAGTYPVYVYAINVGGGENVFLGTKTVSVTSHNHNYQVVNWNYDWSKDKPSCVAEYKCSTCGDKKQVNASVSSRIIQAATCSRKGKMSYTTTAVLNGKTYTDSAEREIPMLSHTWNSSYTVDKAATYTAEGSKSIHCKNCNTIKPGSQVTIAKLTGSVTPNPAEPVSPVSPTNASAQYRTHVQSYGWQGWVSNGAMSGTSGQAKRLEGIEIKLKDRPVSGSIQYRTHIQSFGWEQGWKSDGAMSGTSGKAKRLEAIQIQLTGEMAKQYDVYYRVHAQSFGWLGWAKNGASAGTAGYAKRLEGIEIRLVEKGGAAPGSTSRSFVGK